MEIKDGVLYNVTDEDIHFGKFTVPNNVKRIGSSAFQNCEKLKSVKLHNGIESIGVQSFANCTSLVAVNIPDSVKNISARVFINCISLVSVKLPKGLQTIKEDTFSGCTKLKDVGPLDEVLEIGYRAFHECSLLETIDIPNCQKIDSYAFSHCMSLKKLALSKDIKGFSDTTFEGCKNLDLTIDTSLFFITRNFKCQTSLSGVNSVNIMDRHKIYGCYIIDHFIKCLQQEELKRKIDDYLFHNRIYEDKCYSLLEHAKFIEEILHNLADENLESYDYRKDFNNYMERYISDYKYSEEPEIITFDDEEPSNSLNDKVEKKLNITNTQNMDDSIKKDTEDIKPSIVNENIKNETVRKVVPLNKLENYDFNDINAYANRLGLDSYVKELRQMISLRLLGGNVPKKCFKDISHDAFIREMLQCLSEDSNYDYKSAVDNYMKSYIETHKLQNVGNEALNSGVDNQEIEPSKLENLISENDMLKQKIAQLEQEILMKKNQGNNTTSVSLDKEPIIEVSNNSVRKK